MKKAVLTAAIATGTILMCAPAALAVPTSSATPASTQNVVIKAPTQAQANKSFNITGTADKSLAGSKVQAYQNGKKFNATRTVSSTGDIGMRIVSGITGANKFAFTVTDSGGNVWTSNIVVVNVVR